MLRLYIAWRLLRLVRRAVLVGALLALLAAASSGRLAQIADRLFGPDVAAVQHDVQQAVRHALRPAGVGRTP